MIKEGIKMENKEIKVLIVDDSKNIRKLISVVLGKYGYTFIEAANGIDALEKVDIERPDLVVLDIIIPGVNGLKVCEDIRKNPATKDTGIIILTSEATYEAREQAHKAGADVFMIKPFEPNDLRAAAKEVLERRKH
jgi:DNA-binding response OmpR family regulator